MNRIPRPTATLLITVVVLLAGAAVATTAASALKPPTGSASARSASSPSAPPPSTGGDSRPDARYYRSVVTRISPAVPGLTVNAQGDGSVTLVNHTGETVTVRGYADEPYLQIGPDGVLINTHSFTAEVNATHGTAAQTTVPLTTARPSWKHLADGSTAIWRDYRTGWTEPDQPQGVASDPHRAQPVSTWALRLDVGDRPVVVDGSLEWTGAPWITRTRLLQSSGALLALLVVVVLAGRRGLRRRRSAGARRVARGSHQGSPTFPYPSSNPAGNRSGNPSNKSVNNASNSSPTPRIPQARQA